MPGRWEGSGRRARLPRNWAALRRVVLDRDGWQCTAERYNGVRCRWRATDVDHVDRHGGNDPANLASLCAQSGRQESLGTLVDQRDERQVGTKRRYRNMPA